MNRSRLFSVTALLFVLVFSLMTGCATLDERQRGWIFQPSDRSWGASATLAKDMDDVWVEFNSKVTDQDVKLHGLWLAAGAGASPSADTAPILLYLHGARWNVTGSSPRIRRMQELGFSVLAVDYRGFGKSSNVLPSETMAYEDARAAWDWLPLGPLITQRFESASRVAKVGSPLLVVHGEDDTLIKPELGRKLFEAAQEPKAFVLVPGGSHHNTNAVGQAQYRVALAELFKVR